MNETGKTDFISQKETLAEVLESLFSVKESGFWTVVKVIIGIAAIGWLADSILPLLQIGSVYLVKRAFPGEPDLWDSITKLIVPLIFFVFFIGILFFIRQSKLKALKYSVQGSYPHRGVIVSLSPLNEKQITLSELESQIDSNNLKIEDFFNQSNWGQLAFTVAHHSPVLQKCWVCTTPISTHQFQMVKKLINYVSLSLGGREIECFEKEITDENDISMMARTVSEIYQGLKSIESNLHPRDVISNYTGGTAAMSGGIILATLNESREIEYINQKYFGKLSINLLKGIDQNLAIVTSKTNLTAVHKLN
jgi:hypothetical protein